MDDPLAFAQCFFGGGYFSCLKTYPFSTAISTAVIGAAMALARKQIGKFLYYVSIGTWSYLQIYRHARRLRRKRTADIMVVICNIEWDDAQHTIRRYIRNQIQDELEYFLFKHLSVEVHQLSLTLPYTQPDFEKARVVRRLRRWLKRTGASYLVWGEHFPFAPPRLELNAASLRRQPLHFLPRILCSLQDRARFREVMEFLVADWLAQDIGAVGERGGQMTDRALRAVTERTVALSKTARSVVDPETQAAIDSRVVKLVGESSRRGFLIDDWRDAYKTALDHYEAMPGNDAAIRSASAIQLANLARRLAWADGDRGNLKPAATAILASIDHYRKAHNHPALHDALVAKAWFAIHCPNLFPDEKTPARVALKELLALAEIPGLKFPDARVLDRLRLCGMWPEDYLSSHFSTSFSQHAWREQVWLKTRASDADVDECWCIANNLVRLFGNIATDEARNAEYETIFAFFRNSISMLPEGRTLLRKSLDIIHSNKLAEASLALKGKIEGKSDSELGASARKLTSSIENDPDLHSAHRLRFKLKQAIRDMNGAAGASEQQMLQAIVDGEKILEIRHLSSTKDVVSLAVIKNNFCYKFDNLQAAEEAITELSAILGNLGPHGIYVHAYSHWVLAYHILTSHHDRAAPQVSAKSYLMRAYELIEMSRNQNPNANAQIGLANLKRHCDALLPKLAR